MRKHSLDAIAPHDETKISRISEYLEIADRYKTTSLDMFLADLTEKVEEVKNVLGGFQHADRKGGVLEYQTIENILNPLVCTNDILMNDL